MEHRGFESIIPVLNDPSLVTIWTMLAWFMITMHPLVYHHIVIVQLEVSKHGILQISPVTILYDRIGVMDLGNATLLSLCLSEFIIVGL